MCTVHCTLYSDTAETSKLKAVCGYLFDLEIFSIGFYDTDNSLGERYWTSLLFHKIFHKSACKHFAHVAKT
jgi:hypothetical protein